MNENDLKCCGNCLYRRSTDMGTSTDEGCDKGYVTGSFEYCNEWEYDGLHRELRQKEFNINKV